MSKRIFVATRKGLFTLTAQSSDWQISNTAFLGEPVTAVLPDRRNGWLYAALNLGHFGVKLHRSKDQGQSWQEIATPSYPKQPEANQSEPQSESKSSEKSDSNSLKQIWIIETGGADQPGLLWAGTIPGGLFCSKDNGDCWQLNEPLWQMPQRQEWFGGGADQPGIHSIAIDPRNSNHIIIAISSGGVWASKDGGESWQCSATGMRAAYLPPDRSNDPNLQDPHRLVQCQASPDTLWVQHHNGIFRSTDLAASWHEIKEVSPSVFGFAVAVHPHDANTAWFVPAVKDECRIPANGQVVVTRTRDGGKSFETLRNGLPQTHAYHLFFRHCLDVDQSGNALVIGSTTGGLWLSSDQGDHWQTLSKDLPPIYAVRFAAE